MALITDTPYPSLDHICEDGKTLRAVSPAYAGRDGELTAILQYVYQSVLLGACGNAKAARLMKDIAVAEMRHLETLGTLITRLGAPPVFTACPPYPVSYYSASCVNYTRTLSCMIEADIRAERSAIYLYTQILETINNREVAAVIARIREDEELHLEKLNELLGEISAR